MSSRIDLADALRKESSLSAFTFDGPYRLTGHDLLDNMYCADNGRWYETPVDWYGLARAARQTSRHQSALYFKRNVLLGCYIPHPLLSRQDFSALALDWFVFGNAFLELRSNMLGEPLKLRHAPAKYMRRGSDLESWWYVQDGKDAFQFRPRKVCHLMNPDINQKSTACRNILAHYSRPAFLIRRTCSENCTTTTDPTPGASSTSVQRR